MELRIGDLVASPIVEEIGMIVAIKSCNLQNADDFITSECLYDIEWYNAKRGECSLSCGVAQYSVRKWRKLYLFRRKHKHYV